MCQNIPISRHTQKHCIRITTSAGAIVRNDGTRNYVLDDVRGKKFRISSYRFSGASR